MPDGKRGDLVLDIHSATFAWQALPKKLAWSGSEGRGRGGRGRDMDTRRFDLRRGGDGPGELPLLRAPVGRVEHAGGRAEPGERIQQFIPLSAVPRQTVTGERHPQFVALARLDEDRTAPHLVDGATLFQRANDLSGGGPFQAGIQQRQAWRTGQPRQAQHRGEHRPRGQKNDDTPPHVECVPQIGKLLHHCLPSGAPSARRTVMFRRSALTIG